MGGRAALGNDGRQRFNGARARDGRDRRQTRLGAPVASTTAEGGESHALRLVDKVGHSAAEGTRGYLALSLDSGGFPVVDVAFNDFGGPQTPVSHAPDGSVAAVSPDAAATEPKT